jgi:hypothetical protein
VHVALCVPNRTLIYIFLFFLLRATKEELDNNSDLTKTLLSGKLAMEEQVGLGIYAN